MRCCFLLQTGFPGESWYYPVDVYLFIFRLSTSVFPHMMYLNLMRFIRGKRRIPQCRKPENQHIEVGLLFESLLY